jgi:pimeloyl-ACP methyl ester carboxylesterase
MTASFDTAGPTLLRHGRADLALHHLRGGDGRPLLLLHGLGEASPATVPGHLAHWPGPVLALDFTGHGASTHALAGGYTAEILMADVVTVLAHTGPVTVLGRGLGAYIALLAAGARPGLVRGAILTDGPGLVGGGVRPSSQYVLSGPVADPHGPDPFVIFELAQDVRPPDYAVEYLRLLLADTDLPQPLAVCTVVRPGWLDAVVTEGGDRVAEVGLDKALALYASGAGS